MQENKTSGLILDVDRFSTHDGPGIRMAVFMKGCPLACAWCHSPESQSRKPQLLYQIARCRTCGECIPACNRGAIAPVKDGMRIDRELCTECFECTRVCRTRALRSAGAVRTVGEITEILRRDKVYYTESGGGLTVSGGEPLMQSQFVLELTRTAHEMGIHTAVETCGMGSVSALLDIACFTDLIYYDIKLIDSGKHEKYTKAPNERILSNLRALAENEAFRERICVRIPCIPGINDGSDEIDGIANFVRECGISRMELLPYNGVANAKYEWLGIPYPLAGIKSENENLGELRKIIDDKI